MPASFRVIAGLLALLAVAAVLAYLPAAVSAQTQSSDATLSALTVSPRDIIGFSAGRTNYEVGVASTVTTATVAATTNDDVATAVITPADADTNTAGHQIALSAGRNAVTVMVTAEDTTTTRTYRVNVNRGVTTDYGWKASDDLDGLITAGNNLPTGIWSNGDTMWVADTIDDDKTYAYTISGTAPRTSPWSQPTTVPQASGRTATPCGWPTPSMAGPRGPTRSPTRPAPAPPTRTRA